MINMNSSIYEPYSQEKTQTAKVSTPCTVLQETMEFFSSVYIGSQIKGPFQHEDAILLVYIYIYIYIYIYWIILKPIIIRRYPNDSILCKYLALISMIDIEYLYLLFLWPACQVLLKKIWIFNPNLYRELYIPWMVSAFTKQTNNSTGLISTGSI